MGRDGGLGGGLLFVLGDILGLTLGDVGLTLGDDFAEVAATGTFFVRQSLFLFGTASMPFGLYTSQSEAAGTLGVVGFLLAFLGTALLAGLRWTQALVVPFVATEVPRTSRNGTVWVRTVVRHVRRGPALVQGGHTARWRLPGAAAIVLIVGSVLPFVGFILPASAFLFGTAVAWLGFVLFTGRSAPAGRPSRVS